jgi:hypothetical protein
MHGKTIKIPLFFIFCIIEGVQTGNTNLFVVCIAKCFDHKGTSSGQIFIMTQNAIQLNLYSL